MSDLNRQQKNGPTELYRHFDAKGQLLYVGISLSTVKRLGEHRCDSGWTKKITTITIERFKTRRLALDAERAAVQREHPLHNVTGKLRGYRHGGSTEVPRQAWRVAVDAVMAEHCKEHGWKFHPGRL